MKHLNRFKKHVLWQNLNELMLEAKVVIREDLISVLNRLDNRISKEILNLVGKDVDTRNNYFDTSLPSNDIVSYSNDSKSGGKYKIVDTGQTYDSYEYLYRIAGLPGHRYPELPIGTIGTIKTVYTKENAPNLRGYTILHFVSDDGRNAFMDKRGLREFVSSNAQAKIGRVMRKLLKDAGIEFKDTDIEEFVNSYKTRIDIINDKFRLLSIVDGEDIRKSYLHINNVSIGQLGNSCMRYTERQGFLDIYVYNKDVCQLLTLKDEDNGKIRGRALIWTLMSGEKYLDRPYCTNDTEMSLMQSYAKEQGWAYLDKNREVIYPNGETKSKGEDTNLIIQLKELPTQDLYPYMDSVYTLSKKMKYLGSKYALRSKLESGDLVFQLQSENGGSSPYRI